MKIPGDSSRELRGSQPCDETKVKKANACIDFIIRNNVAREPCSTLRWSDPPGVFWMVLSANLCRLGKPGAWPRWGGGKQSQITGENWRTWNIYPEVGKTWLGDHDFCPRAIDKFSCGLICVALVDVTRTMSVNTEISSQHWGEFSIDRDCPDGMSHPER